MSLGWAELRDKIGRDDHGAVCELLTGATEPERVALARDLEVHIKSMTPEDWRRHREGSGGAFVVAVLGTMPSAARAAALLGRRDMRDKWGRVPVSRALRLIRAREPAWLGDLAGRLADRLNPQDTWMGGWYLVDALMTESGTAVPATEGFVRGWLAYLQQGDRRRHKTFADRLRESPHLDVLLPAVFEIDGLGAELAMTEWGDRPAFSIAVAGLVAEGRLDRKTILAATVDRLVRGDRAAFLRPFVLLHEELAPTLDELADYAMDYARLLPGAPSVAAGMAQRALRAVDDVGRLELDTLLDASRATLIRKEKMLVKAQLTWLDKVARREPGRAGEVLETIAAAFDHPALDIQERALTLIERHSGGLDLSWLAEAATGLGGDLPARVARLSGADAPAVAPVAEAVLPLPPGPVLMPAPIGSVDELAVEVYEVLVRQTAVRWERLLAGLVALRSASDLSPLGHRLDQHPINFGNHYDMAREHALGTAIRVLIDRTAPNELERGPWHQLVTAIRAQSRGGNKTPYAPQLDGPPERMQTLRIVEIAALLREAPVPMLVATPTHVNGNLDASALVERLRRAEAEGWEPWPLDFEQALLRLPRGTSPAVADGLTSRAGRRLVEWLAAGGLPDPVSSVIEQHRDQSRPYHENPGPDAGRMVVDLAPARPGVLSIEEQLVTLTRSPTMDDAPDWRTYRDVLCAAMPHHREVIAAWTLPHLAALADQDERAGIHLLPMLAEADGPFGPAMSLAVAYVLNARHETDRVAAVDAFLTLAARGTSGLGVSVGRALGELGARGMVKVNRAVLALADVHRAGASATVWEVLATALPPMLSAPPRGLPDLLEFASLVAGETGTRGEIAGLAEIAARKGSSRLLKEARRLQAVLAM